jgi:hypothetical protein
MFLGSAMGRAPFDDAPFVRLAQGGRGKRQFSSTAPLEKPASRYLSLFQFDNRPEPRLRKMSMPNDRLSVKVYEIQHIEEQGRHLGYLWMASLQCLGQYNP